MFLKHEITDNNLKIFDSFEIIHESYMKMFLENLRSRYKEFNYKVLERTDESLINEWQSHNLLFELGIFMDNTKDVDLESNPKWFFKLGYWVLSRVYRLLY